MRGYCRGCAQPRRSANEGLQIFAGDAVVVGLDIGRGA